PQKTKLPVSVEQHGPSTVWITGWPLLGGKGASIGTATGMSIRGSGIGARPVGGGTGGGAVSLPSAAGRGVGGNAGASEGKGCARAALRPSAARIPTANHFRQVPVRITNLPRRYFRRRTTHGRMESVYSGPVAPMQGEERCAR